MGGLKKLWPPLRNLRRAETDIPKNILTKHFEIPSWKIAHGSDYISTWLCCISQQNKEGNYPHQTWALCPVLVPQGQEGHNKTGMSLGGLGEGKRTKMVMGLETLAHEERLKGLGSFSLEKQGVGGILSQSYRARNVGDEGILFMRVHCDGRISHFRPNFVSRHKKNFPIVKPNKGWNKLPGDAAKLP